MSSISNNVQVIDNYLPEDLFKNLFDLTSSYEFPWTYDDHSVDDDDTHPQLVHTFYSMDNYQPCSPLFDELIDILDFCNVSAVGRIKLNGNFKESTIRPKPFHRDVDDIDHIKKPLKIMVLHLNTNNGFTIIKDDDGEIYRIKCVENRAILFPNSYEHTGTSCTDIELRKVLNMVYI